MNIKQLGGDRLLIKESTGDKKTSSGIIVTKTGEPGDFLFGVIETVGKGKLVQGVGWVPVDYQKGENVMFQYGTKISVNGEIFMLVNEADVVLTLE